MHNNVKAEDAMSMGACDGDSERFIEVPTDGPGHGRTSGSSYIQYKNIHNTKPHIIIYPLWTPLAFPLMTES